MTAPLASPVVTWDNEGHIVTVTAPTGYRGEWRWTVSKVVEMLDAFSADEWTVVVPTQGPTSLQRCARWVAEKLDYLGWYAFTTIVGNAAYIRAVRKGSTVDATQGTVRI